MSEQLSALIVRITQTSHTTQMSGQFLTALADRKDHTDYAYTTQMLERLFARIERITETAYTTQMLVASLHRP